jgi:hypothetical protein
MLEISGNDRGEVTLDGLLIVGAQLKITGSLRRLTLRHCTLVPGIALSSGGDPLQPGTPGLLIESTNTEVEIESCIMGGLRVSVDSTVRITGSIIDANGTKGIAYAGLDTTDAAKAFGGRLHIENCTVIGKVFADAIEMASNTIFLAEVSSGDDATIWPGPVLARRRQQGCVRFSFLPAGSRLPRRYYCQPENDADEAHLRPILDSMRYGEPSYCQLEAHSPEEIRRGADDESEMGAFHDLHYPQREAYLRGRLDEYLRFGLEAGIFYAT